MLLDIFDPGVVSTGFFFLNVTLLSADINSCGYGTPERQFERGLL